MTEATQLTEYNSNADVIRRTNDIIYRINFSRRIENVQEMLKEVINLYKEIDVELNDDERKIWAELLKVAVKVQSVPQDATIVMGSFSNGKAMLELDLLDMKLRRLAKVHGLLMTNKDDPSYAMLG